MLKVLGKEASLKVFYYLMAVDNVVSDEELIIFDQIGQEILTDNYSDVKDTVINECLYALDSVRRDDNRYDVISEEVDKALEISVSSIAEGVVPRHLLWDMMTIAYADGDYSDYEKRLINHVARKLQIEDDVVLEMNQLIDTVNVVDSELKILENSDEPYRQIRPLVVEAEKRRKEIVDEALALINDDIVLEITTEDVKNDNIFASTGKKIGGAVTPVVRNVSEKTSEGLKTAKNVVGEKAIQGAQSVKSSAGKLLGKIKGSVKK